MISLPTTATYNTPRVTFGQARDGSGQPAKITYNTPHIAKPSGQSGRQAQRQDFQTIGLFDVLLDPWKNPGKYRSSDESSHSLDILA